MCRLSPISFSRRIRSPGKLEEGVGNGPAEPGRKTAALKNITHFHLNLKEIRDDPDRFVIRQDEANASDRSIQAVCEKKFENFEHGLSIINRNTGQSVFKLGKLAV